MKKSYALALVLIIFSLTGCTRLNDGFVIVNKSEEQIDPVVIQITEAKTIEYDKVVNEEDFRIDFGAYEFNDELYNEMINNIQEIVDVIKDVPFYQGQELRYYFTTDNSSYQPARRNQILIDVEGYMEFDIILYSLVNVYPENTNFGLLYVMSKQIANDLEFDYPTEIEVTKELVEEYWYLSTLSYLGFQPEIATEEEVEISRWMAHSFYEYLLASGSEEILTETIFSSNNEIESMKVEWINSVYPDFKGVTINRDIIFSNYIKDDSILFETPGVYWELSTSRGARWGKTDNEESINDSVKEFYLEVELLLEVMAVTDERVIEFDQYYWPVTIKIYPVVVTAGYVSDDLTIYLQTTVFLRNAYISYLDDNTGDLDLDVSVDEWLAKMRTTYFTLETNVGHVEIIEYMRNYEKDNDLNEMYIQTLAVFDESMDGVFTIENTYLIYHYFSTLTDQDMGIKVIGDEYNFYHWMSLMNFVELTHGLDELHSMTLKQVYLDGSDVDWDQVITEWRLFISNYDVLSEIDKLN